ncbi:methyl-accepting chemotaxis protein, partial [Pseudomonas fragariae (ex Marin et al. 2024)]
DALQVAQTTVTALPVDAAQLNTDQASYREQLLKLKDAQFKTETVQNLFEQQLNGLREQSALLSQSQNAKRDSEADQTRTLLISVTAAAL